MLRVPKLLQEENMRREIDAIKNELNSLKGVHRDLEDCHPPQENQPSEQVDSLQASVSNSCSAFHFL